MKGSGLGPGGRLRRRVEIHLENRKEQTPRSTRQELGEMRRDAMFWVERWN
jgi:hypothetical protein